MIHRNIIFKYDIVMLCKKIYDDDGSCIFSNIYIAILLSLQVTKAALTLARKISGSRVGWPLAAGLARENLWGSENPRTSYPGFFCVSITPFSY